MSETKTPAASGCAAGDFRPLEEAWENFQATCEAARIPLCTFCNRVRCFNTSQDALCRFLIDQANECVTRVANARELCLAYRNKRERSEP